MAKSRIKKPKIFISSTYVDLIPYRKKLWDELTTMDITILGMENFGARSSSPLETCLKEVSEADVYVGIIAFKYGSIDTKSKLSYTYLEYLKAKELKKEILIYLFDDNGDIKPKYIDFGSKGEKLVEFKNTLKDNHTVDFFKDPDDLACKVVKSLKELNLRLPNITIRPKALDAKLFRFKIGKQTWMAFIGYLDGLPVELFTGIDDEEMYPIPRSITKGKILKNTTKYSNYAFQYYDKYGYRNTLGGLDYEFDKQMIIYNKIITKMLMQKTPLNVVIETIKEMDLPDTENPDKWKKETANL